MKAGHRSDRERKAMFGRMKGDGLFDHLGLKIKKNEMAVKNPFAQINPEAAYVASLGAGAFAGPTNRQMEYDAYANKVLDINPMDNKDNN
jgi:hypothetical protein